MILKAHPDTDIISNFLKKGGKINKYYLLNPRRGPSLVYFRGWFRGNNVREAIVKALSGK